MTLQVMALYLINGYPVGKIATKLDESRAKIRSYLKDGGITIRPVGDSYRSGRDVVCDSIARTDYCNFHVYAQVKGLDPISSQASDLGVTEKSLTKVYNAYRKLLGRLKSAGVVLPTSQMSGAVVERATRDETFG
jgi:hypothetical protein